MINRKYVGFDVHLATISFCILDGGGKILWESVFPNTAETIRDFLGGSAGMFISLLNKGPKPHGCTI